MDQNGHTTANDSGAAAEALRRQVAAKRTRDQLGKIVSGLDLSSPLLSAINVFPGAAAATESLVASVREMLRQSDQAAELIIANLALADLPSAQYRVRRITAEAVADRWCKSARAGSPTADISFMLPVWLDIARSPGPALGPDAVSANDRVILQLAMLEALKPVLQEIEAFDLFRDKNQSAEHARNVILNSAIEGVRTMSREGLEEGARRQLLSALVRNAGNLYASAWRKEAERIVERLKPLDSAAQMSEVMAHPQGFPIEPIDAAFRKSIGNLAELVQYLALPPSRHPDAVPDELGSGSRR